MRVLTKSRMLALGLATEVFLALPVVALGEGEQPFGFEAGQTVYVRAESIHGTRDPVVEQKVHKKFLSRGDFRVTNDQSEADFVFHVICEYQTRRVKKYSGPDAKWWKSDWEEQWVLVYAEGFAVPRLVYEKGFSTREDLRRAAHWYWLEGSERSATKTDRRSGKLVKVFHKQYRDLPPLAVKASPTQEEFAFGPGQSVYFVTKEITGSEDPRLAGMLIKEFTRRKMFTVAQGFTDADFVFLVFSQYRTVSQSSIFKPWDPGPDHKALVLAEAFAITPDQFKEHGSNKMKLREVAHWQRTFGTGQEGLESLFGLPPRRRHRGLVKRFHEDVAPLAAAR